MKIAIIGAGNMGGAIARGLARGTMVRTEDITVSDPSHDKLEKLKEEFPAINVTNDNRQATAGAEMLMVAVKPWLVKEVIEEIQPRDGQLLVSIAAAVTFGELSAFMDGRQLPMFRIVPNTAISELASMTLISGNHTTPEQDQFMLDIFAEMGLSMMIPEAKIAAATSLMSCGIAYALKYIQAAMQAGIELGIYPKDGMRMVAQSVKGAAELILNNDTHPAVEIDKVCTPGGYTIRGINQLEKAGFANAVINAMKASMY